MAEHKWVKLLTVCECSAWWSRVVLEHRKGYHNRGSAAEPGKWVFSCKQVHFSRTELLKRRNPARTQLVSVLSPIIYDAEIICFIKQNALREELEFLFCLKSRFSYERLTFWVLSLNQASCHPSRLSLTSRLKAVIAAHHHKERFAFNFQAITVAIFESAKPSWYRSTESRLLRRCFFFSPCDPDAVNPVCLPV